MDGQDHRAFLRSIPAATRLELTDRRDAPGLVHLAGHFGLILVLGGLIAWQIPFWWVLLVPQGILLAFLFTLQHECTHKTPFATEALNEWIGWACGILIFQPFLWFRYYHLAHHRHTNDPNKDPELEGLPKPEDWAGFWWHVSTLQFWADKARLLCLNAFGEIKAPYLPPGSHRRLRREARIMLSAYGALLLVVLLGSDVLIWTWLVPLALGFPFLRLYLLAEHGRCPTVANMFDNTRTTYTNRLVRFLAWNMPYHVEHHVMPQVPFHSLPRFNMSVRHWLRHTSPGYVAFARDYVGRFES